MRSSYFQPTSRRELPERPSRIWAQSKSRLRAKVSVVRHWTRTSVFLNSCAEFLEPRLGCKVSGEYQRKFRGPLLLPAELNIGIHIARLPEGRTSLAIVYRHGILRPFRDRMGRPNRAMFRGLGTGRYRIFAFNHSSNDVFFSRSIPDFVRPYEGQGTLIFVKAHCD